MAKSRGTAVSAIARHTARATESVCPIWTWMFSTATVDSSTRMPTARARPPSVIRLIDCPASHNANSEAIRASGMFSTTTITLRQSRRKISTMSPTSAAATSPSETTPVIELVTYGDWSNSKLTWMSSGSTACIRGRLLRTASTTSSVLALARLVTRM